MTVTVTSHAKSVRAELRCSAAYCFYGKAAVGRAKPGQQRRHLFQIGRSAGPLKFGSHPGVTPKQKAPHIEARLQHRERSLAEVLPSLVARLRFRPLSARGDDAEPFRVRRE